MFSMAIRMINMFFYSAEADITYLMGTADPTRGFLVHPHNSNPNPANAAALLKQELAATSAAGAFDADSSGSEATAE